MKKPELLSPCGSPEALQAAVRAGADAVYLGGPAFHARMNAKNFTMQEIEKAVDFCHDAGVSVYITLNTLLSDREILPALRYVESLYMSGVDGLITADLGLSTAIHRYFPDLPLHASTQACAHNGDAGVAFERLGFTRMVAARELTKENIISMVKISPIEIEIFVHGAMCVCHSGQCLMSSVIGGRSGNRGLCAQPCRLPYNGAYPLSLKDMCLAQHMKEILDIGVASLKIEGRMKPPAYVQGVTAIYRKLIDERRDATNEEMQYLASLFSRSGFTDGYFAGKKTSAMLGIRREEDKNQVILTRKTQKITPKLPIKTPKRKSCLPENPTLNRPATKERFIKSARYLSPAQMMDCDDFDIRYLPLEVFQSPANAFIMPYPVLDSEKEKVYSMVEKAIDDGAKHILVTHISQIDDLRKYPCSLHGDYRLNITNAGGAAVYSALEDVILSPELTLPQIRDLHFAKSTIVYGRLPLMTLEKVVGAASLTDRRDVTFPIVSSFGRDLLLNSVPIYMLDKKANLKKVGGGIHFMFTTETPQQIRDIMQAFREGLPPKGDVKRIKE